MVDQIGNDQSLLRDGHGAGQRHHDETVLVASHGFQNFSAFPHLPPGECGVAHGADEVIYGVDLREIERLQRNQLVGNGIVEFAINALAVRLVMFLGQDSPRQIGSLIIPSVRRYPKSRSPLFILKRVPPLAAEAARSERHHESIE